MDQSYPPSETTETDQPRTEERNAKVVVDSNHPFLYPIIIDTKHREEGVHPSKDRVPIPSKNGHSGIIIRKED